MNSKQTPEPDVAPETLTVADAPVQEANPTPKPTKATRKPKPPITLAELAEKYLEHLERDGKSSGTCSSYGAELKLACKELGSDTKIADITPAMVGGYFGSKVVTKLRSGRNKAKPSVDKTRRVLRLALCWAVERKLIASAPLPEATQS
jgi:hypothetical protein